MKQLIALTIALAACTSSAPRTDTTTAVAARRAQMIEWLHDYQVAGEFPTDEAGMPKSVFRDEQGIRCPMAELIYRSGRADLVDTVVAEKNDLRLADVHTGPLADWMSQSGLTRDEIIMVQGVADLYTRPEWKTFELAPNNRVVINTNARPALTYARPTLARERVRGRLETAEAALRKDTKTAVPTIAQAIEAHPAAAPGPVVPAAVVAKRAK